MSELLQAAKAVISWFHDEEPSDLPIEQLIFAVERAEKQNAEFDAWFVNNYQGCFDLEIYKYIKAACIAAQQAERERLWNGVIIAVDHLKTKDTEGLLSDFTDRILEAADNECKLKNLKCPT